jgi:hypothetical protein
MNPSPAPSVLDPPEPEFWQHYSPNHEFPISTLVSVALYALLGGGIVLAAWLIDGKRNTDPVPIVYWVSGDEGTGAGGAGVPGEQQPGDDGPRIDAIPGPRVEQPPELPPVRPQPPEGGELTPKPPDRPPLPGPPPGGSGKVEGNRNGPPGAGGPPGTGRPGPPGPPNRRINRINRWQLDYQTSGGDDHLRKLGLIGCRIALPVPGDWSQVDLIRDIRRRPVQTDRKTVAEINRLPWVFIHDPKNRSSNPNVIPELATALGLDPPPQAIVAFLPVEFEKQLLEKELAYARRHGRSREDQIDQTVFDLQFAGGSYSLTVVRQTYVRTAGR